MIRVLGSACWNGDRDRSARAQSLPWCRSLSILSGISTKETAMGDTYSDPTDHSRTHHQHAGESMIDVYFFPGLFLIAVSVVAFVGCLAAAATNHSEWLLATGL